MTPGLLRVAAAGAGVLVAPGLLMSVFASTASASSAASPAALAASWLPHDSDPRAVALLERATRAAAEQAYAGTQYVSTWRGAASVSVVLEVTHLPAQGTYVSVRDAGGRAGAPVFAADPDGVPGGLSVPGLDGGPLRLLPLNYDLTVEPGPGHEPVRVVARRGDGTVAARFWLDRTSGLLRRREVYDAAGAVVRASAFVDLHPISDRHVGGVLSTHTTPVVDRLGSAEVTRLRDAGWAIPTVLSGQLLLHEARMLEVDGRKVLGLWYSDGLSAVSVFCQRGRLDRSAVAGWRRERVGAAVVYTSDAALAKRLVWSSRGRVWTMLADAPLATVTAAAAQLPHEPERRRGLLGRLVDGLSRVASWLNPFD